MTRGSVRHAKVEVRGECRSALHAEESGMMTEDQVRRKMKSRFQEAPHTQNKTHFRKTADTPTCLQVAKNAAMQHHSEETEFRSHIIPITYQLSSADEWKRQADTWIARLIRMVRLAWTKRPF